MGAKKRKVTKPTICRIAMGQKIVQTSYDGPVSGVDLLNAAAAMVRDCQTMTGLGYKEIFAIVDEAVEGNVFKKKNPTMRASVSEATASEDQ